MPPVLHSDLGASGASRWMACPASVRLSQLAKEREHRPEKASVYANEGSVAHSVCEKLLLGSDTVENLLGTEVEYGGDTILIDDEMIQSALVYCTAITSMVPSGVPLDVEKRFSLDWLHAGMFGTCDCCAVSESDKTLYVFDFKYGKGHAVHVAETPQLKYYALGVLGPKGSLSANIEKVTMTIVQPRNSETGIETETMLVEDLYRWAFKELLPAVLKTFDPEAPCVPGDEQCKWCRGVPICPAMYEKSLGMVNEFFPVVKEPESPREPAVIELPPVESLLPVQVGKALDLFAVLKPYFEKVEEGALVRMKAGEEVPGWKLVHKRSRTKWIDDGMAEAALRPIIGDACIEKKLISPATAKKLVDKALVSSYTVIAPGEITIAPLADKREAVSPDSIDE